MSLERFVNELRRNSINGREKMKIIEAFLGEHGTFYAQLDHLEQVIPAAETLAQVQSLSALLTAALATHAHLEDELLFTALDPYLAPMGPLSVMRLEHDEIESILVRVQEVQDLTEARRLILNAVQIARSHFAKEEQVLFPMAQQALSGEDLTRLGKQWAERRGVAIS
jgi:hemerythrin-like domain-containing protein